MMRGLTVSTVSFRPGKPLKTVKEIGAILDHRAKATVLMRALCVICGMNSLDANASYLILFSGAITRPPLTTTLTLAVAEYPRLSVAVTVIT